MLIKFNVKNLFTAFTYHLINAKKIKRNSIGQHFKMHCKNNFNVLCFV